MTRFFFSHIRHVHISTSQHVGKRCLALSDRQGGTCNRLSVDEPKAELRQHCGDGSQQWLEFVVKFNMRLYGGTSRRLPFKIHLSQIQRCQTSPRQIWYPSTEVKGQYLVPAKMPAQGDLMYIGRCSAQEVLKTSY